MVTTKLTSHLPGSPFATPKIPYVPSPAPHIPSDTSSPHFYSTAFHLRTLSSFRDGIRRLAITGGDAAVKDILLLCDKLRDVDLVPLGVAPPWISLQARMDFRRVLFRCGGAAAISIRPQGLGDVVRR